MTQSQRIQIMIMSGVEDGTPLTFSQDRDGLPSKNVWMLTIGRREDNDLCLRNDTFISRQHANLVWREKYWWLEDLNSTNGTFVENERDIFVDEKVSDRVRIIQGQLFRIGRTWLRLQSAE